MSFIGHDVDVVVHLKQVKKKLPSNLHLSDNLVGWLFFESIPIYSTNSQMKFFSLLLYRNLNGIAVRDWCLVPCHSIEYPTAMTAL